MDCILRFPRWPPCASSPPNEHVTGSVTLTESTSDCEIISFFTQRHLTGWLSHDIVVFDWETSENGVNLIEIYLGHVMNSEWEGLPNSSNVQFKQQSSAKQARLILSRGKKLDILMSMFSWSRRDAGTYFSTKCNKCYS